MPAYSTMKDILGSMQLDAMPKEFIAIYQKLQDPSAAHFHTVMSRLLMAAVIYEAGELLGEISPVVDRDLYKKADYVPASLRKHAMNRAVQMGLFVQTELKGAVAWERISTAAARQAEAPKATSHNQAKSPCDKLGLPIS